MDLSPNETHQLNQIFTGIVHQNKQYNGQQFNCTSFVAKGLNDSGLINEIEPEAIYDLYNLLLLTIKSEAFTPNTTYNQLKTDDKATIIKKADSETQESYEDAILDKK